VWRVDGEHEGTSKVFIWADGAVAQIADCLVEGLRVSDRLVVWAGEGQNGREIFVAELDGSQANKRVQPTSGVAYRMEYHGQRARLTR
jgi:hypothetical protein